MPRPLASRSDTKLIERLCSEDRTLEKALKLFESLKTLDKFEGKSCLPNVCAFIASQTIGSLDVEWETAWMTSSVSEDECDNVCSDVRAHLTSSERTISFAALLYAYNISEPKGMKHWMNILFQDYQHNGALIHGPDMLTFAIFFWVCSLLQDARIDLDNMIAVYRIKKEPLKNIIRSLSHKYWKLADAVAKATITCNDSEALLVLGSISVRSFLIHSLVQRFDTPSTGSLSETSLSAQESEKQAEGSLQKTVTSRSSSLSSLSDLTTSPPPTRKRGSPMHRARSIMPHKKRPRPHVASRPSPSRGPSFPVASNVTLGAGTVIGQPTLAGHSTSNPTISLQERRSAYRSPEIQTIESLTVAAPSFLPLPRGPGRSKPVTTPENSGPSESIPRSQPTNQTVSQASTVASATSGMPAPAPASLPVPATSTSDISGGNALQNQLHKYIGLASSAIIAHVEQYGCNDLPLRLKILDLRTRRALLEKLSAAPNPTPRSSSSQAAAIPNQNRDLGMVQLVRAAEGEVVSHAIKESVQSGLDMELLIKVLDLQTRLVEWRKVVGRDQDAGVASRSGLSSQ